MAFANKSEAKGNTMHFAYTIGYYLYELYTLLAIISLMSLKDILTKLQRFSQREIKVLN